MYKQEQQLQEGLPLCCDGIGFLSNTVLFPVLKGQRILQKRWLKGNVVARKANGNKLIRAE
jgi:hypothetical protein